MPGDSDPLFAPAPSIEPAVFVASLVDYVNGILHGRWIPLGQPPAAVQRAVAAMLADSPWTVRTGEPAEEWVILDHEGVAGHELEGPGVFADLVTWADDAPDVSEPSR